LTEWTVNRHWESDKRTEYYDEAANPSDPMSYQYALHFEKKTVFNQHFGRPITQSFIPILILTVTLQLKPSLMLRVKAIATRLSMQTREHLKKTSLRDGLPPELA